MAWFGFSPPINLFELLLKSVRYRTVHDMSDCQTHLRSDSGKYRDIKLYLSISEDRGAQDMDDAWRICHILFEHCCIVPDVTVWRWPRGHPRRHHHRWDAWMVRRRRCAGNYRILKRRQETALPEWRSMGWSCAQDMTASTNLDGFGTFQTDPDYPNSLWTTLGFRILEIKSIKLTPRFFSSQLWT